MPLYVARLNEGLILTVELTTVMLSLLLETWKIINFIIYQHSTLRWCNEYFKTVLGEDKNLFDLFSTNILVDDDPVIEADRT